jgi:hypothetical protein
MLSIQRTRKPIRRTPFNSFIELLFVTLIANEPRVILSIVINGIPEVPE